MKNIPNPEMSFAAAGEEPQQSLVREMFELIRHNKKYWLIPVIIGLLGFGLLVILGGSSAAPFIYTLF